MNVFKIVKCKHCQEVHMLEVTDRQLEEHRLGKLAQYAFPTLTADERELLISGICGVCYDNLFAEVDEDESENY